ncbi:MAG: YcgN family cysteine cluster protein [Methylocystis sp.]|nr:YcgN family cysteine cluster protein [Methylocystis sp.]MBI3275608.1 YcgN family cysteine cluster protein [Methylocystis sp.]
MEEPFWTRPLDELTRAQWEQLCDGCGRCCLVKLEDEDTGAIHHTSVGCALLNADSCRCRAYRGRQKKAADCVRLSLRNLATIAWLPPTCAYRLRFEGRELPAWHPLVTGDAESVHAARVSVRGRVEASEDQIEIEDLPDFIALWPKRWPKKRWL